MKRIYNTTVKDVNKLAEGLAAKLEDGDVLALIGPLGAGKTTFTQALGKKLKVASKISSPTFTFLHQFPAKLGNKKITLYHLDLYRAAGAKEVWALGLKEFWGREGTVTVIEWADKIKRHLPKNTKIIYFDLLH